MIKIKRGALASIVLLVVCTWRVPAQFTGQAIEPESTAPEAINLDIPPAELPDPESDQERELAIESIQRPEDFHNWLLSIHPERGPMEELARLAILFPDDFNRAHPKSNERVRAEAAAAHAILNPHFVFP